MQLRFKCLDKACTKKFITKLALNTHCKKNHPDILKQRAIREQQQKLAVMRAQRAATAASRVAQHKPSAPRMIGSTAIGSAGIGSSGIGSAGIVSASIGSAPRMTTPTIRTTGMGISPNPMSSTVPSYMGSHLPTTAFPSTSRTLPSSYLNRFPSNNTLPYPNGTPSISQYSYTTPSATYSSLKSTLLRQTSGYMQNQNTFPSSSSTSSLRSTLPNTGYNPMVTQPYGTVRSTYGMASGPGLSNALVPNPGVSSMNSMTSPSKVRTPYQNNLMQHQSRGSRFPRPSLRTSIPSHVTPSSGWSGQGAYTSNGGTQGGHIATPAGMAGGPRFKRVHASQFLSPASGTMTPSTTAAKLPSPSPNPSDPTPRQHKCRFSSCHGKSFLTEQALLSHYSRHHEKPSKKNHQQSSSEATPSQNQMKHKCSTCDVSFLTQEGLDRHCKRVHTKKVKQESGDSLDMIDLEANGSPVSQIKTEKDTLRDTFYLDPRQKGGLPDEAATPHHYGQKCLHF
jgi:hypothetical protein